ncbi:unnamed protein product [Linum trigynum]|uniref:Uncharacterized protein n=1 Tax=Linum trigynum TaxID=586398 RepID=A0AAV2GQ20_9ROSI
MEEVGQRSSFAIDAKRGFCAGEGRGNGGDKVLQSPFPRNTIDEEMLALSSPARRLHCRRRNPARRSQRDAAINELLLFFVTPCLPLSLSSSESGSPHSNRER